MDALPNGRPHNCSTSAMLCGTWKQDAQCIYADDSTAVALVRESGTAPSGDAFDNLAVYVYRFGADGKVNRLWTNDLAHEELEHFWKRNPIEPTS